MSVTLDGRPLGHGQPLDDEEQIEALKLHAIRRGLELPDETATFLLNRLPRDMHTLCTLLDELDEAALIAQRRLTVPFVSAVLKRAEPGASP